MGQKVRCVALINTFLNFSDCTLPFNVGVRTSNERIPTVTTIPPVDITMIDGQKWDQEEPSLRGRGVCLNYKQIPCNN